MEISENGQRKALGISEPEGRPARDKGPCEGKAGDSGKTGGQKGGMRKYA